MFKKVLKSVATLHTVALLLSVLPLGVSANDSSPENTGKITGFSVSYDRLTRVEPVTGSTLVSLKKRLCNIPMLYVTAFLAVPIWWQSENICVGVLF